MKIEFNGGIRFYTAIVIFFCSFTRHSLLRAQSPDGKEIRESKRAGDLWQNSAVGMRFRWCPPGKFMMGSPPDETGRRADEELHEVTISRGYYLGEREVTQKEWEEVMETSQAKLAGLTNHFVTPGRLDRFASGPNYPIHNLTWEESREFCKRLTEIDRRNARITADWEYRLPTEAEWEYACRSGSSTATYAGDLKIIGERNGPALDGIAWYGGNSSEGYPEGFGVATTEWIEKQYPGGRAGPRIVGQKKGNAWGLRDMLGNVWEWCSDGYSEYRSSPQIDPEGNTQARTKVIRGGSWFFHARNCRAANRISFRPSARSPILGFRVLLGPTEEAMDNEGE